MTIQEFEAACDRQEKEVDKYLTAFERAVELLRVEAERMDRIYNNT